MMKVPLSSNVRVEITKTPTHYQEQLAKFEAIRKQLEKLQRESSAIDLLLPIPQPQQHSIGEKRTSEVLAGETSPQLTNSSPAKKAREVTVIE